MRKGKRANNEMMEETPCFSCGGRRFTLLFTAGDFDQGTESFNLVSCEKCHLVRTEPILSNEQLERYYSLPYYGSGKEKFKGLAERLTYFLNFLRAGTILTLLGSERFSSANTPLKIIDIGCGRGNLLKIFNHKGYDCYGVERTEFPGNSHTEGFHFYKGNLQEILFAENFFEAAILWHVLEHLDNPISMIGEIARILKPKGILAIAVPNFGSFQAKFFGASWFHLDLPRHTYHFDSDTLFQCLNRYGFKVIKKSTFSLEQNVFGFVQSFFNQTASGFKPNHFYRLLKKSGDPSSMRSLILWGGLASLIFPVALMETLISGIFGRGATLIVYAEKG
jgi:2-polyprenyl-3-methyl-5-hydroxy-6-metoxy-1,4-benzoquinol methylase